MIFIFLIFDKFYLINKKRDYAAASWMEIFIYIHNQIVFIIISFLTSVQYFFYNYHDYKVDNKINDMTWVLLVHDIYMIKIYI